MTTCTKCKVEKPAEAFPFDHRTMGKRETRCKSCKNAQVSAWRKSNIERARKRDRQRYAKSPKKWERHIAGKYGISAAEYNAKFFQQQGACAICKKPSTGRLSVDHDHVTGAVRGLLCQPCNKMLGQAFDAPQTLIAAAFYLNAPAAQAFIEAYLEAEVMRPAA